ncbi:hypothetical protein BCR42DRAFT_49645 [Absidia repens]|uniref:Uncharacterized protein n=1 Tax=Absidia repens TaxID=90262 RepID=A0A1X2IER8_9FUNG|nr:hypothetical protein BCR42DRAFT_49645 [Absidia repens]
MADILQVYQLPDTHLPGSVLLSKYICRDPSVMSAILAPLFATKPPDNYYCGDTTLINGARCDVLYLSPTSMPVMVQIQKKVSKSWLRTILAQCCHVLGSDDPPVLLIFSVDPLPSDIKTMCRVSGSAPYAYDMSAPLFAQKIRLFCPDLAHHYLASQPSPPSIVALSSFFSDQYPSALASTFYSKNTFYNNLYILAFRFCQRMAIDLEPAQHVTDKTTTTTTSEYLLSQQQHHHHHHRQQRRRSSVSIESNPVKRRHTVEAIPENLSRANAKKHHHRDQTIHRFQSPAPPLVSHRPPSTPVPVPINRRISNSDRSSSPSTNVNTEQQEEDDDEEVDQLEDDDEERQVNGNEWNEKRITSVKQHDQDVIIDYCQEQLELNKDWKTIYDEGYGKYFAYKNKESLRRCMQTFMPMEEPIVTRTDQHNMDDIVAFCRNLLDQNIEWGGIYRKGRGKYFAFQNSYVLQKAYLKHLELRKSQKGAPP